MKLINFKINGLHTCFTLEKKKEKGTLDQNWMHQKKGKNTVFEQFYIFITKPTYYRS